MMDGLREYLATFVGEGDVVPGGFYWARGILTASEEDIEMRTELRQLEEYYGMFTLDFLMKWNEGLLPDTYAFNGWAILARAWLNTYGGGVGT